MKTMILAALLAATTLRAETIALQPASAVRLHNDGSAPAHASFTCVAPASAGGRVAVAQSMTLAPDAIADVATDSLGDCAGSWQLAAPEGVRAFAIETDEQGVESQTLLGRQTANACDVTRTLLAPLGACRNSVGTVAVAPVAGASYSWSVEGAAIVTGIGTERVTLAFGSGATTKVSVIVSASGCSTTASAAIALRDPFAVSALTATGTRAGEPLTVAWSYNAGDPTTQLLSGPDFLEPVVIPRGQRSYTYTPATGGDKEFSLTASIPMLLRESGSRRRAAHQTIADAANCSTARATTMTSITGCQAPSLDIKAPDRVNPGDSFTAQVNGVAEGSEIKWTFTNATPETAIGSSVTVQANKNGTIRIRVEALKPGVCPRAGTQQVDVALPCVGPTATITKGPQSCLGGDVIVKFTGTPPFRGVTGTGVLFNTTQDTYTFRATKPGTYRIGEFRDASCPGEVRGEATFEFFQPTATLSGGDGGCPTSGTVSAKFAGVPPFSGKWSDGVTFTTNTDTTTRTAPAGTYRLAEFRDSRCDVAALQLAIGPGVTIGGTNPAFAVGYSILPSLSCAVGNPGVMLEVTGRHTSSSILGPLSVTWSDGVTVNGTYGTVRRIVNPAVLTTYRIVKITNGTCEYPLPAHVKPITVASGPRPTIVYEPNGTPCADVPVKATLANTPANAKVTWAVKNARIVDGDGTRAITFIPNETWMPFELTAEVDALGICSLPQTFARSAQQLPQKPTVVAPADVLRGRSMTLKITFDEFTVTSNVYAANGTLTRGACTTNRSCSYSYSNNTAGVAQIWMEATGCNGEARKWGLTFPIIDTP